MDLSLIHISVMASAIRQKQSILFLSDFDGTAAPFVDDPEQARVSPEIARSFKALAALPHTQLWFVTGGSGPRTARVLMANHLQLPAAANYGSDSVTWDGEAAVITRHPDVEMLDAFWESLIKELSARTTTITDDVAIAESDGLIYVERKGTAVALHPKGAPTNPELPAMIRANLHAAVDAAKLQWSDLPFDDLRVLSNNGNFEVVAVHTSKYDAVDELIGKQSQPIGLIAYCADDSGDLPGLQRVREAADAGLSTFMAAVYNRPEPEKNRAGTPAEVIEVADITFDSPAELGVFLTDVLSHINL